MASIVERQTGGGQRRLYVVFNATDRETLRARKVWELVPGGVKEAKSRKAEVEVQLRKSGRLWPAEPKPEPVEEPETFREYAARWLETRARHRVTDRVLANYKAAVDNVLSPALGDLPLTAIRRRHVNDLVASLAAAGKARNTINNAVIPLRAMLFDAVDDEIIESNPAARIKIPDSAPVRKAIVPTPDELERIIAKARPEAREVITVIASLGLRRGEAFALTWGDVSFDEQLVHVHATNDEGRIIDRTKTKAGTRLVPLFESARKVLAARRDRLPAELTWPLNYVFCNSIGGPMEPGNWHAREWLPAMKAAGTRHFHLHELRHFAITALDEQGMSGKLRSEIVGHAGEQITNSIYTHIRRERVAAAARMFDPLTKAATHD